MMIRKCYLVIVSVSARLVAGPNEPWKEKPVTEWNESDARQLLTDSPWAKSVAATIHKQGYGQQGRRSGIGGIRIGGAGGHGMGGRRRTDRETGDDGGPRGVSSAVTVRWESALPVQEAQLKIQDASSPSIQEGYYSIAVLGIPNAFAGGDLQRLESQLKHQGELKLDGKHAIRSLQARVLPQESGILVLFTFPKSKPITEDDKHVAFAAHIGQIELTQTFELNEMIFAGKLEL